MSKHATEEDFKRNMNMNRVSTRANDRVRSQSRGASSETYQPKLVLDREASDMMVG